MKKTVLISAVSAILLHCTAWAQTTVTVDYDNYSTPAAMQLRRTLAEMQSSGMPYSIAMTVNGDPCTGMGFAWFTNPGTKNGEVQIVAKENAVPADFDNPDMSFPAAVQQVNGLNYSIEKNKLSGIESNIKVDYLSHKAKAAGLTPATTYSYRVGSADGWSEIGTFTTASADKNAGYSFIYITDTQAQNDEMFNVSQKTVHAARKLVPEAAFILCNGDLVETSGSNNSEWEYEQWFSTMQDIWLNTPLVVTMGNHDISGNRNFAYHFNNDNSYNENAEVPTDMDGTVFSFVRGDVLYLVMSYENWNKPGYLDSLGKWMRSQVGAHKDVKWKIASFPKNMFTGSRSHQDDADGKAVRAAMLPLFAELGINMAFQGHDHIYEVIGPVNNTTKTLASNGVEEVLTVGEPGARENMTGREGGVFNTAAGTLYFLNNSAGKKKYEPRTEEEMIASYSKHEIENYWGLFSGKFGQTGEPTFSRVDVTPESFTVSTYTVDDNGNPTLFDSFKVINNPDGAGIADVAAETTADIRWDAAGYIRISNIAPESVDVYDIEGRNVCHTQSAIIPTDNYTIGLYIVKASAQNKTYTGKILIK